MFKKIEKLVQLEENEDWQGAVNELYCDWLANPNDADILIRLIAECWYVMMLWDCCMPTEILDYAVFRKYMYEAITHGNIIHSTLPAYLSILGYMMVQTPYLFVENNNDEATRQTEKEGYDMLQRAVGISPSNVLCQLLLSGFSSDRSKHHKLQQRYVAELNHISWDATAVSQYFHHIIFSAY